MLYLLDANILITAANTYYGITRVPEFWSWLEHQGGAGYIKMPLEIYEEILEGRKEGDELLDWAKRTQFVKRFCLTRPRMLTLLGKPSERATGTTLQMTRSKK